MGENMENRETDFKKRCLKTCYFPMSVLVAGRGRKVQPPFVPRRLRKQLLPDHEEHRPTVPRLPRKRPVQRDEVEVEHEALRPLEPLPAVKGSQSNIRTGPPRENL